MVDLQGYLEKKICEIISSWNEDDIYAISFFVYANESYEYGGVSNVTTFSVGYNTESDSLFSSVSLSSLIIYLPCIVSPVIIALIDRVVNDIYVENENIRYKLLIYCRTGKILN